MTPTPTPDEWHDVVERWRELFNAGRYFEAHEVLEGPWLHASDPDKTALKGLIHVAVALHHYQRGNAHGARVKSISSRGYLAGCRQFAGLNVEALVVDLQRFLAPLFSPAAGGALADCGADWPRANRVE